MVKSINKIGLWFISFISFFMVCGMIYQYISTKMDETAYAPPGKLVDVGGFRLHIHCTGEGGPTVVFDAGMGVNFLGWALVQPEVATFTRVCSYDRAGYGYSDESPRERTSQNIVEELHTLLNNSGEKGPYILVGHSFGGINVRLYASNYPEDVAGVVLVDSSHEKQLQELPTLPQSFFEKILFNPYSASIGLFRLFSHLSSFKEQLKGLPLNLHERYLATIRTTKYMRAVTQEGEKFEQSLNQLSDCGGFLGDKPLIVISAGKFFSSEETGYPQELMEKFPPIWESLQRDLVTKSTQGEQLIAEHSGHMIPFEQPQIIIEAIRKLVHNATTLHAQKLSPST